MLRCFHNNETGRIVRQQYYNAILYIDVDDEDFPCYWEDELERNGFVEVKIDTNDGHYCIL